ncbi:MAG TPA: glycoside hydrolase family 95 protein [Candidatus Microbacterium stercoravium]|uniref:Glycoside hydrolase family 95 protein n=1 Tax=Candidatus Microbacterium stercoravium TaxID=2838697 RepID=A0A9D2KH07_9MICO|nr:glycoside hydrolase family 95 protein [Candidatus Microbacterium stercoravium]
MTSRSLSFTGPAEDWLEALPIGNGRLGGMCWGGAPARIDLNEESVWSGGPGAEAAQPGVSDDDAAALVRSARSAMLEGRHADAERDLKAAQRGHAQAFLPVGTLVIDTGESVGTGSRNLSLADAVHTSTVGGLVAETFVSPVHDVLVHRVTGAENERPPGIRFASPLRTVSRDERSDGVHVVLRAPIDVAPGHEPQLPAAVWPGPGDESVSVVVDVRWQRDADGLIVLVAVETTFSGPGATHLLPLEDAVRRAAEKITAARRAGVLVVREQHVEAHRELFDRVALESPSDDLVPLLFDYGRYLLIASSRRPARLPANLQGVWNAEMRPPWSSAYTLNINLEMNYWAAETANLAETTDPLVAFIGALADSGRTTARRLGAGGWAAHHNSDAWAHTSAVGEGGGDPSWAFWPMAGPWLLRHLLEHRAFGAGDEAFDARTRELVRGAAEFLLDWLVERPTGRLGTLPSTSPENTYIDGTGTVTSLGETSTMDLALVRDTLTEAASGDDALARRARAALERLPSLSDRAASRGVLEWAREEIEVDPHHRHVSHLYPLFPGASADAAFERAATASLDRRGADSTGWSLAWKMALWSRLRRTDRLDELIELFFRDARDHAGTWSGGLYPNLFAAHPPFQIDGNLGFTAGIVEALVQSHRGEVELLPALPTRIATGSVRGLVARPGLIIDIEWSGGELVRASLSARPGRRTTARLRWRGRTCCVEVRADRASEITPDMFLEAAR